MEALHNLAFGFEHALTIHNLMYCAIGCVVGTLVGLLPGLGPLATISLLLPLTYSIDTTGALIMLAGIYYGAQYGDSVSAITMKIPHASSIVACIDGYAMTLKGKTGLALFTAGFSSFIGGTVAIIVLTFLAPKLGEVAFLFGPADYCALMMVGFVCVSFVTTGSLLNGLAMCLIGVLLGQIGTDVNSGVQRYTMDLPFLADGVGLVSIALGCFGIAEITKNLDSGEERSPFNGKIHLMPTWEEFKRIIPSALRGSVIGSFLGILPGGGPAIAQFAAYAIDKKVSKYKHEIGTGCIEGVAGQAAADEAAARTSFIPLMSIGIPENAVMALMMAAFIIKGIQPGPNMIAGHPELFWGLVASMWVGNCFLIILNVPLVRYWLSVFKIPYAVLFPGILFFCCIGTYSVNNNLEDLYITAAFGLLGFLFMKFDLDAAPLMLGFILGPMLEENFRRTLLLSRGSFGIFFDRPISGTLLSLIGVFIAWQTIGFFIKTKKQKNGAAALPAAHETA
ncbi:MAG: tripartite tricarboxylate transporter permease [Gammaproteobacteria bacterium]|uniref:tripartite tricarboxylate transporter permease n=1 Tax=unclassified Pseudacidovorax TaxID=2620592 RepID=UPI001B51363E|nr:tripartite tricarboxylate transporter permease [Pseudacidovorax sp.]MBP6896591.1 tripartite tricarboxylate transporter permease [Pseudacidovorax sp.]